MENKARTTTLETSNTYVMLQSEVKFKSMVIQTVFIWDFTWTIPFKNKSSRIDYGSTSRFLTQKVMSLFVWTVCVSLNFI